MAERGGEIMACMLNEWEFAVKRLNHESQSRLLVTVAMMSRTSHLETGFDKRPCHNTL